MYGRTPVDALARRLRKGDHATILFLSDHGAARSVIAEAIVNRFCAGGFTAISAGLEPEDRQHPMALEMIRAFRLPHRQRRPASVEEILNRRDGRIDYVIALWDRASGEPYPLSGKQRDAASWDIADPRRPMQAGGGIVESRLGFVRAYDALRNRVARFISDVNASQGRPSDWRPEGAAALKPGGPRAPSRRLPNASPAVHFDKAALDKPLTLGASMLLPPDKPFRR